MKQQLVFSFGFRAKSLSAAPWNFGLCLALALPFVLPLDCNMELQHCLQHPQLQKPSTRI